MLSGIRSESVKRIKRWSVPAATSWNQTEFSVGSRSSGPETFPSGRNTTWEPCPPISGKNASPIVNTVVPVAASEPTTLLPPPAVGRAAVTVPSLRDWYGDRFAHDAVTTPSSAAARSEPVFVS